VVNHKHSQVTRHKPYRKYGFQGHDRPRKNSGRGFKTLLQVFEQSVECSEESASHWYSVQKHASDRKVKTLSNYSVNYLIHFVNLAITTFAHNSFRMWWVTFKGIFSSSQHPEHVVWLNDF
jgi:hypothetical protein